MQTFLPYKGFMETAAVLDYRRLGKQRVETMQIMKALVNDEGWVNHPATLMWKGYELALLRYQEAVCSEWVKERGFKDTCLEKTSLLYFSNRQGEECVMPPWLGDEEFHLSHQSALFRKDPSHYHMFYAAGTNMAYRWPRLTDENEAGYVLVKGREVT